jgi:hypothetical protein
MPGYRSLPSIGRIAVDVMSLSVPVEHAPGLFQLANQDPPFHTSNSTGSRRAVSGAGDRSCVIISS